MDTLTAMPIRVVLLAQMLSRVEADLEEEEGVYEVDAVEAVSPQTQRGFHSQAC
jgi:hypothetical protein